MVAKQKKELCITVEPATIEFKAPFDRPQTSVHKLTNNNQVPIAIKLKTSNNHQFQVSVVHEIVQPGKFLEVKIYCQPFTFDRSKNSKDRIGIWYCQVPETAKNAQDVWKDASSPKKHIMRVQYEVESKAATEEAPKPSILTTPTVVALPTTPDSAKATAEVVAKPQEAAAPVSPTLTSEAAEKPQEVAASASPIPKVEPVEKPEETAAQASPDTKAEVPSVSQEGAAPTEKKETVPPPPAARQPSPTNGTKPEADNAQSSKPEKAVSKEETPPTAPVQSPDQAATLKSFPEAESKPAAGKAAVDKKEAHS